MRHGSDSAAIFFDAGNARRRAGASTGANQGALQLGNSGRQSDAKRRKPVKDLIR
jgi:hypothetical protein